MTTRGGARFRALRAYTSCSRGALCSVGHAECADVGRDAAHGRGGVAGTGLGDQVIKVSWSGFHPTQDDGTYGVVILQCRAHPKSVTEGLQQRGDVPVRPEREPAGGHHEQARHRQRVHRHHDHGAAARAGLQRVDAVLAAALRDHARRLRRERAAAGQDPGHRPDQLRRNAADCPPVVQYNFSIEAEASAAPALYQWAAALCTGKHAFTMDITNTSSNQAREDFFSGEVDLGVTSLPPEPGEITAGVPKFSVAPLDLTAVVIAYNIIDSKTDKQITDLTLTPRLVARLLSDTDIQSFFRDPELRKLNPHHSWPISAADPGLRGEKNADTWMVSKWVNADQRARAFLDGKDRYGVQVNPSWRNVRYPTDVFAARNSNGVYFPRIGQEGVAAATVRQHQAGRQRSYRCAQRRTRRRPRSSHCRTFKLADCQADQRRRQTRRHTQRREPQRRIQRDAHLADRLPLHARRREEPACVPAHQGRPRDAPDEADREQQGSSHPRVSRLRGGLGQATLPPGYVPLPTALQLQTLRYTGDLPGPALRPRRRRSPTTRDPGAATTPAHRTTSRPDDPTRTSAPPTPTTTRRITTTRSRDRPHQRHRGSSRCAFPTAATASLLPIVSGLGILAVWAQPSMSLPAPGARLAAHGPIASVDAMTDTDSHLHADRRLADADDGRRRRRRHARRRSAPRAASADRGRRRRAPRPEHLRRRRRRVRVVRAVPLGPPARSQPGGPTAQVPRAVGFEFCSGGRRDPDRRTDRRHLGPVDRPA